MTCGRSLTGPEVVIVTAEVPAMTIRSRIWLPPTLSIAEGRTRTMEELQDLPGGLPDLPAHQVLTEVTGLPEAIVVVPAPTAGIPVRMVTAMAAKGPGC